MLFRSNDTATTEIYTVMNTLSLHDALPISRFNLLIETQPQYLKLDMSLIRDVHEVPEKQALIDGTCLSMRRLGIDVIAEGVETVEEYKWLREHGIRYFQGFLFARPGFQCLPEPIFPD